MATRQLPPQRCFYFLRRHFHLPMQVFFGSFHLLGGNFHLPRQRFTSPEAFHRLRGNFLPPQGRFYLLTERSFLSLQAAFYLPTPFSSKRLFSSFETVFFLPRDIFICSEAIYISKGNVILLRDVFIF